MEGTRFGASQICCTNRNFSFCREALIKVNRQECLFKGDAVLSSKYFLLLFYQRRLYASFLGQIIISMAALTIYSASTSFFSVC